MDTKIKELTSKINLPARASIYYLLANAIGKAIAILTTPLFTRLISGEDYGELTLYMTILGAASLLCSSVSCGSGIYIGIKRSEKRNDEFIKSTILSSLLFSLAICILLFTFSDFFGLDKGLLPILSLQIICDGIVGVTMCRERFFYNYKRVVLISLSSSIIPALASSILLFLGVGWEARIYSLLATSIVITAIQLIRVYRLPGKARLKTAIYSFSLALPLIPQGIYSAVTSQTDKLFIQKYIGASALAKYSVVHSLGIALQFGVSALFSSLGPWFIRKLDNNEEKKAGRVISAIYLLFTSLSLILISLSPEAMKILAPPEYSEALPALIPIALSVPLAIISSSVSIALIRLGATGKPALISLLSLVICLSLNYTLIPTFGYIGAGFSILLTQMMQVLIGLFLIEKNGYRTLVKPSFVGAVFISSGVIAFAIYLGLEILPLRFLILTIPISAFCITIYRSIGLIME